MSTSDHPHLKRVLAWALGLFCWTCAFPAPVAVQGGMLQAAEIPVDDYASRAKDLLRILYPDVDPHLHPVFEDERQLADAGVMSIFRVRLYTFSDLHEDSEGNPCYCEKLVLGARFGFDALSKDKELMDLVVSDATRNSRQRKFGELLGRHPEWAEVQVIRAMREAGARYAPENRDQLLHDFPLGVLKPYIGELKLEQAEFALNRPEGTSSKPEEGGTVCFWRVKGTSHFPSGATREYSFVVDAFDASLSSIFSH